MIYGITILLLITIVYFISMIWVIIGFNKIKAKQNDSFSNTKAVKVSVIIPFRNEQENLHSCLKSIQNQNFDSNSFEVILVNDHSIDESVKIVENFIASSNINIRLTSLTDQTSKKEALKQGIKLAANPIIATTDADCVLPNNWLKNIQSHYSRENDMLLGPVMFKSESGFLSAFQTLDMLAIQGVEFGALGFNQPILNNAANLSYSSDSFNKIGGFDSFDTPSGDDIFLLEKFKSQDFKIKGLLSNDFIVETKSENNWFTFFNQRVRWSSKSKHYSDKLLLFFSGLILIQNIALLFIYLGILFVENQRLSFLFLLLTKWLIDFILLFLVASFFKRKKAMFYFIPAQILYPIYVVIIWISSVLLKFEWKGRKY
ncbi:MAG: glycosyltransferase [Vicingaceae bacterium]|nr:glycosyltransferase [Vicingaceae bacterium]